MKYALMIFALTLVGADGVKHLLSVPVHDGKNNPMKVKLDELPSR